QAEDGIRDKLVTGVQTCALPIYEDVEIAPPRVMRHVVDARADTPESVVVARDQRRHCRGMLALLADGRAVLAVAGDVEDRAHLALERQGLADIALAARVVDAGRQRRQSAL